jgi:hypothetical protein
MSGSRSRSPCHRVGTVERRLGESRRGAHVKTDHAVPLQAPLDDQLHQHCGKGQTMTRSPAALLLGSYVTGDVIVPYGRLCSRTCTASTSASCSNRATRCERLESRRSFTAPPWRAAAHAPAQPPLHTPAQP